MATPITAFEGANTVPNLLKRRYGKVAQTIPLKFDLYKWLDAAPSFDFKGRDFVFPVITGPGGGFTAYAEGGMYPGSVKPVINDATLPITQIATLVAFSNLDMMLGKSDADGFLRGDSVACVQKERVVAPVGRVNHVGPVVELFALRLGHDTDGPAGIGWFQHEIEARADLAAELLAASDFGGEASDVVLGKRRNGE